MADHPLLLPEVIHRVGCYVPLWTASERIRDRFEFHPKQFLQCLLVCRAWRTVLSPLLWVAYDDIEINHDRIAPRIFKAGRPLIRYLNITRPWPLSTFRLAHLEGLALGGSSLQTGLSLITSNRGLKDLAVSLDNCPMMETLMSAFLLVPNVVSLKLFNVIGISPSQIARILVSMPALKELYLEYLVGLEDLEGERHVFSVTHLYLHCDLKDNPALVDMIQWFPDVEVFSFRPDNTTPAIKLASVLKKYCPKLKSLNRVDMLEFHSNDPLLRDAGFMALIRSSVRLESIKMLMPDLTDNICQTLLEPHARSLESIHLIVRECTRNTFVNVRKILDSCLNLRSFTFASTPLSWLEQDALVLFEAPLNCPSLKSITLSNCEFSHFSYPSDKDTCDIIGEFPVKDPTPRIGPERRMSGFQGALFEYRLSPPINGFSPDLDKQFFDALAGLGWIFEKDPAGGKLSKRDKAHLLPRKMFKQLLSLPTLRRVDLNDSRFSKKIV
ncbi:hypothetical protein CPB97_001432 [Podila verticillata]|nr:hypothetical protein CPB97_001432 [Podila verticillata]